MTSGATSADWLGVSRARTAKLALLAILLAEIALFIAPKGFSGGPSDDQRYYDIALGWFLHGPDAGTTHWSLRMPLIVAIDGMFRLFGPSITALLVVPRLFYALFVGVTAATVARVAGASAWRWWLALVIASPVLHEMATSCFPEMVELSFAACSIAAYLAARRSAGLHAPAAWMAISGLALGLAVLTRETAGFIAFGYLWMGARRPAMPRWLYVLMGAAFMLPIAGDILWLWSQTGDWLYRLHVDESHILIPSDHMRGHVFTGGSPFLDPALARRWIPAGPTRINWVINPLGDFLIDPAFGFVLLGCMIAMLPFMRGRPRVEVPRVASITLLAIAIGSYLIVTWVFTLRPQPRYYLPVACVGQVWLALAIAGLRARPELRRRAAILAGSVLALGAIVILLTRDAGWQAKALVPYMAAHPGRYTSTDEHVAGRSVTPAAEAGISPPVIGPQAAPGQYRVRLLEASNFDTGHLIFHDPGYAFVAELDQPMPLLVHVLIPDHHDALLIERRIR